MILDSCDSTHQVLKKQFEEGAVWGSWVCAQSQTQGRGRYGKTWVSEPGNLHLSLLVPFLGPFVDGFPPSFSPTWAPLFSAHVIQKVIQSFSNQKIFLKWPNDLVVSGRKLAGILCEGVSREGLGGEIERGFLLGIGLNVIRSPQVDQPTISLKEMGIVVELEDLRKTLVQELLLFFNEEEIRKISLDEFKKEFLLNSYFQKGQKIQWSRIGTQTQSGSFMGLGKDGELLVQVENPDGTQIQSLYSEEVSL